MKYREINFDGIVGPTHNYSGLSYGNIASLKHQLSFSNPKEAALQGLQKMKFLADKGIPQALLPPHARPHMPTLRQLGFEGDDAHLLKQVHQLNPELLFACSSAASMWTANAATVSPSADTSDRKVHITPANLSSKFHRSIEASFTEKLFQKIFNDPKYFTIHPLLPQSSYFADEGAANHNRFCKSHSEQGIELFVWGRYSFKDNPLHPNKFSARQAYEASQMIAKRHQLVSQKVVFAQQNPEAVDAGVFHNDVISVANEYVYLFHEKAFVNGASIIDELSKKMEGLILIPVLEKRVSLEDAVASYMFNSQLVTMPDKTMRLIAPIECLEIPTVHKFLQEVVEDRSNPIEAIDFLNLRQSMKNGGGPACLRLRIVLNENELAAMHPGVLFTDELYHKLKNWIEKHYRDRLHPNDLADVQLLVEAQQALDELTTILKLGHLYYFQ